jgi:hypothetical protein
MMHSGLTEHFMDPLTTLYERLRTLAPPGAYPAESASYEEWLQYWNDDDTDLGNLRNFEHWLSRRRTEY